MQNVQPDGRGRPYPASDEPEARIIDSEALLRKAFEEAPREGCAMLFRWYHAALYSHAIRFVYSKAVAEDIVADIFCRFWEDRIFEKITVSYRAYLFKSVRHAAYNHLRRELFQRTSMEVVSAPTETVGADDLLHYDEMAHRIDQAIADLPPRCKAAFLMSRVENRTYEEIAAKLRISAKAVEKHISRALKTLRERFKKD